MYAQYFAYLVVSAIFLYLAWHLLATMWQTRWLRELLWVTLMVILLAPAEIPNYSGHYAPAIWVVFFEALFQHPGYPDDAGLVFGLSLSSALIAVLAKRLRIGLLIAYYKDRRRNYPFG